MRLKLVLCLVVAVAGSVACHGLPIAALMVQLSSADSGQRTEAREGLLSLGAAAVPSLIEATASDQALLRWEAVNLLGALRDLRATDAVLLVAMTDPDVHARWRSNWAITNLDDGSVISRLLEGLVDDDATVAWNSAVTLSLFGVLDAVPALHAGITALGWRQWEAVNALGRVWNDETDALLIPLLEQGPENVRKETALSLGRIGGAEALVSLLNALDSDPATEVRWRAAMMVGSMGDRSALPRLLEARSREADAFVIAHIDGAIERLSRDEQPIGALNTAPD